MKKKRTYRKHRALIGYSFMIPWLIGVSVLFVFPMLYSLLISFSNINSMSGFDLEWAGLENYKEALFGDVNFVGYFAGSIVDAVVDPILILAFSLLIAYLLNKKIKFRGMFRLVFFLPVILGSGFIMEQVLGQNVQEQAVKVVSEILLSGELAKSLPYTVISVIQTFLQKVTVILWSSGVQIVLFIGGLQGISEVTYEAARIDGAGKWEQFWLITFPLLLPTTLLVAIYTIVDSFASASNKTLVYIVNRAFGANKFELSAAMGWMYFGFIFVLVLAVYSIIDRYVKHSVG